MLNQNKILTTLNQPLPVQLYSMIDTNGPKTFSTLEGVPLGTDNNADDGEIGAKVIVIATRNSDGSSPATEATLAQLTPAQHAIDIGAGNDSTIFDPVTRALWVGTGGDVKVDMVGGETITFGSVPSGSHLLIAVTKVYATGTSASGIVGLY